MADADAGLKHNIGPVVFAAWMDFDEADIPYRIRNGERSLGKKHRQSGNGYCKPKKIVAIRRRLPLRGETLVTAEATT